MIAIILGLVAVVLLVIISLIGIQHRAVFVSNLIMSLTIFLARSCFIYYINPLANPATRENSGWLSLVRDLQPWLVGWVILSALGVLIFNVLVPYIHKHFYIQRTPPGQKDRVIPIDHKLRRSA